MAEDIVSAVDENNGATSAPISVVVEGEVINGEVLPDPTQVADDTTVNSRYQ